MSFFLVGIVTALSLSVGVLLKEDSATDWST